MVAPALIRNCVTAVFEINTYVRDALFLRKRLLAAICFQYPANERRGCPEKILGYSDQRGRFVGRQAAGGEGCRAINEFFAALAADNLDDVRDAGAA